MLALNLAQSSNPAQALSLASNSALNFNTALDSSSMSSNSFNALMGSSFGQSSSLAQTHAATQAQINQQLQAVGSPNAVGLQNSVESFDSQTGATNYVGTSYGQNRMEAQVRDELNSLLNKTSPQKRRNLFAYNPQNAVQNSQQGNLQGAQQNSQPGNLLSSHQNLQQGNIQNLQQNAQATLQGNLPQGNQPQTQAESGRVLFSRQPQPQSEQLSTLDTNQQVVQSASQSVSQQSTQRQYQKPPRPRFSEPSVPQGITLPPAKTNELDQRLDRLPRFGALSARPPVEQQSLIARQVQGLEPVKSSQEAAILTDSMQNSQVQNAHASVASTQIQNTNAVVSASQIQNTNSSIAYAAPQNANVGVSSVQLPTSHIQASHEVTTVAPVPQVKLPAGSEALGHQKGLAAFLSEQEKKAFFDSIEQGQAAAYAQLDYIAQKLKFTPQMYLEAKGWVDVLLNSYLQVVESRRSLAEGEARERAARQELEALQRHKQQLHKQQQAVAHSQEQLIAGAGKQVSTNQSGQTVYAQNIPSVYKAATQGMQKVQGRGTQAIQGAMTAQGAYSGNQQSQFGSQGAHLVGGTHAVPSYAAQGVGQNFTPPIQGYMASSAADQAQTQVLKQAPAQALAQASAHMSSLGIPQGAYGNGISDRMLTGGSTQAHGVVNVPPQFRNLMTGAQRMAAPQGAAQSQTINSQHTQRPYQDQVASQLQNQPHLIGQRQVQFQEQNQSQYATQPQNLGPCNVGVAQSLGMKQPYVNSPLGVEQTEEATVRHDDDGFDPYAYPEYMEGGNEAFAGIGMGPQGGIGEGFNLPSRQQRAQAAAALASLNAVMPQGVPAQLQATSGYTQPNTAMYGGAYQTGQIPQNLQHEVYSQAQNGMHSQGQIQSPSVTNAWQNSAGVNGQYDFNGASNLNGVQSLNTPAMVAGGLNNVGQMPNLEQMYIGNQTSENQNIGNLSRVNQNFAQPSIQSMPATQNNQFGQRSGTAQFGYGVPSMQSMQGMQPMQGMPSMPPMASLSSGQTGGRVGSPQTMGAVGSQMMDSQHIGGFSTGVLQGGSQTSSVQRANVYTGMKSNMPEYNYDNAQLQQQATQAIELNSNGLQPAVTLGRRSPQQISKELEQRAYYNDLLRGTADMIYDLAEAAGDLIEQDDSSRLEHKKIDNMLETLADDMIRARERALSGEKPNHETEYSKPSIQSAIGSAQTALSAQDNGAHSVNAQSINATSTQFGNTTNQLGTTNTQLGGTNPQLSGTTPPLGDTYSQYSQQGNTDFALSQQGVGGMDVNDPRYLGAQLMGSVSLQDGGAFVDEWSDDESSKHNLTVTSVQTPSVQNPQLQNSAVQSTVQTVNNSTEASLNQAMSDSTNSAMVHCSQTDLTNTTQAVASVNANAATGISTSADTSTAVVGNTRVASGEATKASAVAVNASAQDASQSASMSASQNVEPNAVMQQGQTNSADNSQTSLNTTASALMQAGNKNGIATYLNPQQAQTAPVSNVTEPKTDVQKTSAEQILLQTQAQLMQRQVSNELTLTPDAAKKNMGISSALSGVANTFVPVNTNTQASVNSNTNSSAGTTLGGNTNISANTNVLTNTQVITAASNTSSASVSYAQTAGSNPSAQAQKSLNSLVSTLKLQEGHGGFSIDDVFGSSVSDAIVSTDLEIAQAAQANQIPVVVQTGAQSPVVDDLPPWEIRDSNLQSGQLAADSSIAQDGNHELNNGLSSGENKTTDRVEGNGFLPAQAKLPPQPATEPAVEQVAQSVVDRCGVNLPNSSEIGRGVDALDKTRAQTITKTEGEVLNNIGADTQVNTAPLANPFASPRLSELSQPQPNESVSTLVAPSDLSAQNVNGINLAQGGDASQQDAHKLDSSTLEQTAVTYNTSRFGNPISNVSPTNVAISQDVQSFANKRPEQSVLPPTNEQERKQLKRQQELQSFDTLDALDRQISIEIEKQIVYAPSPWELAASASVVQVGDTNIPVEHVKVNAPVPINRNSQLGNLHEDTSEVPQFNALMDSMFGHSLNLEQLNEQIAQYALQLQEEQRMTLNKQQRCEQLRQTKPDLGHLTFVYQTYLYKDNARALNALYASQSTQVALAQTQLAQVSSVQGTQLALSSSTQVTSAQVSLSNQSEQGLSAPIVNNETLGAHQTLTQSSVADVTSVGHTALGTVSSVPTSVVATAVPSPINEAKVPTLVAEASIPVTGGPTPVSGSLVQTAEPLSAVSVAQLPAAGYHAPWAQPQSAEQYYYQSKHQNQIQNSNQAQTQNQSQNQLQNQPQNLQPAVHQTMYATSQPSSTNPLSGYDYGGDDYGDDYFEPPHINQSAYMDALEDLERSEEEDDEFGERHSFTEMELDLSSLDQDSADNNSAALEQSEHSESLEIEPRSDGDPRGVENNDLAPNQVYHQLVQIPGKRLLNQEDYLQMLTASDPWYSLILAVFPDKGLFYGLLVNIERQIDPQDPQHWILKVDKSQEIGSFSSNFWKEAQEKFEAYLNVSLKLDFVSINDMPENCPVAAAERLEQNMINQERNNLKSIEGLTELLQLVQEDINQLSIELYTDTPSELPVY